jgi:hypothetical protein
VVAIITCDQEKSGTVKVIKRKYISRGALIISLISLAIILTIDAKDGSPNNFSSDFYLFVMLLFEVVLMRVAFFTKNDNTKNIVTGMAVVISIIFILVLFYTITQGLLIESINTIETE